MHVTGTPHSSRKHPRLLRLLAWVVMVAFAVSCTKEVVRGPLGTRHYSLNMDRLDPHRITAEGLEIESVVLTPAQWPLEASFKQLLQGDFMGVIDNFDLSFRSSRLRDDMLELLFDEGYLPAFVRVRNTGASDRAFEPATLTVVADKDTTFYPVPAEDLPGRFQQIDWAQTGLNVVLAALLVVLVVAAAKEGRSRRGVSFGARVHVPLYSGGGCGAVGGYGAVTETRGLLRARVLKPGEINEGFVFFLLDRTVADWTSAHLEMLP